MRSQITEASNFSLAAPIWIRACVRIDMHINVWSKSLQTYFFTVRTYLLSTSNEGQQMQIIYLAFVRRLLLNYSPITTTTELSC